MTFNEAKELVELANSKRLQISSAPCSLLGETAQTIWKALREERVGKVRLVYAELDDGLIHKMPYKQWLSESGTAWPYQDEFEVGCTLEHAGYYLTWLAAFFGPVESVTAFSSCLIPDKLPEPAPKERGSTPDFSVACLKFTSGVVARLTCGIVAPHDHRPGISYHEGLLVLSVARLHPSAGHHSAEDISVALEDKISTGQKRVAVALQAQRLAADGLRPRRGRNGGCN
jgi:predicted dehydrogenase